MPSPSDLLAILKIGIGPAILALIIFLKKQRDNALADKSLTDLKLQEIKDAQVVQDANSNKSDSTVIQEFVSDSSGDGSVPKQK